MEDSTNIKITSVIRGDGSYKGEVLQITFTIGDLLLIALVRTEHSIPAGVMFNNDIEYMKKFLNAHAMKNFIMVRNELSEFDTFVSFEEIKKYVKKYLDITVGEVAVNASE